MPKEKPPHVPTGVPIADRDGRMLLVSEVRPSDPEGRNVRGRITLEDGSERDYACDYDTFLKVWRPSE